MILLYEMKPFTKASITASRVKSFNKNEEELEDYYKEEIYKNKKIARPTMNSNFNPSGIFSCTNNKFKKKDSFKEHLTVRKKSDNHMASKTQKTHSSLTILKQISVNSSVTPTNSSDKSPIFLKHNSVNSEKCGGIEIKKDVFKFTYPTEIIKENRTPKGLSFVNSLKNDGKKDSGIRRSLEVQKNDSSLGPLSPLNQIEENELKLFKTVELTKKKPSNADSNSEDSESNDTYKFRFYEITKRKTENLKVFQKNSQNDITVESNARINNSVSPVKKRSGGQKKKGIKLGLGMNLNIELINQDKYDVDIYPALKKSNVKITKEILKKQLSNISTHSNLISLDDREKLEEISNENNDYNLIYEDDEEILSYEGYLVTFSQNQIPKKNYYKLINKDLFCKYFILI